MQPQSFTGFNDLKIAADPGGNKNHPPVILLHGGGQTRHAWRNAALELFELGFYVISMDLRSHGDSEWAKDSDYSPEAIVGDLYAIA